MNINNSTNLLANGINFGDNCAALPEALDPSVKKKHVHYWRMLQHVKHEAFSPWKAPSRYHSNV